jgi:hypothetical protein
MGVRQLTSRTNGDETMITLKPLQAITNAPEVYDYGWMKTIVDNIAVDERGRSCRLVENDDEWHTSPGTGEEEVSRMREISLDATSTSVLNAVGFALQAGVGRSPHFPERSLGCRIKTGSLRSRL